MAPPSRGRRLPPALLALLGGTITAALGVWKHTRSSASHQAATEGAQGMSLGAVLASVDTAPVPPVSSTDTRPQPSVEPPRTFRGDRARRHRSPHAGPAAAPSVRFAWDAGGAVEAMPAITVDGDVIVASLSGRVARLSPEGAVRWTVELGERIYASPLLSGDRVVVGSDAKKVVALVAATGKKRWELDVDGEADTAPAETTDGDLVVAAGRVVYRLRADGAVRFRLQLPRKIYASPAVADDGTVYVGAQDGKLRAVTPTGSVIWTRDLGGDVDCAPAIGDDGTVFAASDAGVVVAFNPRGEERWRATVGGFVRGGLTVRRNGDVLAGTYGPGPRVVALDGASGAERWSFRVQGTGAPEFGIHGAPVEDARGRLYFGAQDDAVYALDPEGKLLWRFATGGDVDAPLVPWGEGVLYVGSDDGHLYALH